MRLVYICIVALVIPELVLGASILAFFPMPIRSHHECVWPLLKELASRGHVLTAVLPFKMEDPPPFNYTEILIPNFLKSYQGEPVWNSLAHKSVIEQTILQRRIIFFLQEKLCKSHHFKELLLSNLEFDVVILESFFMQESTVVLAHRFNAIPVQFVAFGNSHWAYSYIGNPYNPSYIPDKKLTVSDTMDFPERFYNTFGSLSMILIERYYVGKAQILVDECFRYTGWETRPSITQLLSNTSILLVNSHFSLNYPYPMSPNVIDIGGLHIRPNKPLPKDIQIFMDEATDGVIYFSLGSNLVMSSILTGEILEAFITAFAKLKQKVLWKWDGDGFPVKSPNVKVSSWFPQQSILAHNNCKIFITHGGFLSITEAVAYGVPLIGIPFFGDQHKNMKHVTTVGYGIKLDFKELSDVKISQAIEEILFDPKYKEAVENGAAYFRDRPQSALDLAAYWVEYVIRHKGAPHLKSALAKMPWYESMLLDVITVFLGILIAFLTLTVLCIKKFILFNRIPKIFSIDETVAKKTN